MFQLILTILFIALAAWYSFIPYSTTIIHEIGHYFILKAVFKEANAGVVIGDINGESNKSFRIFGIPIERYTRPKDKMQRTTRGLVYPWDKVYSESSKWKVITFAIAGPAAESFLGLIIILLGIYLLWISSYNNIVNCFIAILVFSTVISSIFIPFWKLWQKRKEEPTSIENEVIRSLTKTTYGLADGRLIWDRNNRWLFCCYASILTISFLVAIILLMFAGISVILKVNIVELIHFVFNQIF